MSVIPVIQRSSLLPITLFASLMVVWVGVGRWRARADLPNVAALHIDDAALQLGVIDESSELRRRVTIENLSSHPVAIAGWSASCECLRIIPNEITLEARGRAEVEFSWNLIAAPEFFPGQFEYPVSVSVGAHLTQEPLPGRWNFRGTVRRLVVADEPEVWVGTRIQGETSSPTRTVRLRSSEPLTQLAASCEPPWITSRIQDSSPAACEWSLVLTADKPGIPPGKSQGQVLLSLRRLNGAMVTIPVCRFATELVNDVAVQQSAVVLSREATVAPETSVLTLRSRSGRPFRVTSVREEPEGLLTVTPCHSSDSAYRIALTDRCPNVCRSRVVFEIEQDTVSYPLPVEVSTINLPECPGTGL